MKSKFKFKLESFLKLKVAEKRQLEFKLAKLLKVKNKHIDQVEHDKAEIAKGLDAYNTDLSKGISAAKAGFFPELVKTKRMNIKAHHDYIKKMDKTINEATKILSQKEAEIKVLTKMKEEQFKKYKKKIEKKEFEQIEEDFLLNQSRRKVI